jgi:hypothetical protein
MVLLSAQGLAPSQIAETAGEKVAPSPRSLSHLTLPRSYHADSGRDLLTAMSLRCELSYSSRTWPATVAARRYRSGRESTTDACIRSARQINLSTPESVHALFEYT